MTIHTHRMTVTSYGLTDRGKIRPSNEDALFLDDAHQLYAVADGLGGLPGGAEASQRIVELLRQTMNCVNSNEARVDLAELIIGINQIVAKEGFDAHPFSGWGSTLTLAQIVDRQLLIAHIGDSAAYRLRASAFVKLTIDHTMAQELIEREGTAAHVQMPPEYPHTLTRCVGQNEEVRVDQTRTDLEPGDCVLLCTDGLNKVLSEAQIHDGLAKAASPEDACNKLVRTANKHEGPDNITLVVVQIA